MKIFSTLHQLSFNWLQPRGSCDVHCIGILITFGAVELTLHADLFVVSAFGHRGLVNSTCHLLFVQFLGLRGHELCLWHLQPNKGRSLVYMCRLRYVGVSKCRIDAFLEKIFEIICGKIFGKMIGNND